MSSIRERLGSAVIWTVVATVAITVMFTALTGGPFTWSDVVHTSIGNAVFSAVCVSLCVLVLPKLAPWARMRLPFALAWIVIAGVLALIGTAGSLLAMTVAVIIGMVPAGRFFAEWYHNSWRVSVYFTLVFGLAATVIGELRYRLTSTTVALRTKERDEAEARRLAAEAQLASLESRVQPHFFFNTLNSIAALVRDDPAAAERVVEQLGALMRSSLDIGASPLVPLEQELTLVRGYLDIERIRFGDRLRYNIDVETAAGSTLVPRLSLQTLVENSIKYAVSPRREGGTITIRGGLNDGHLRFEISDDGPGFDAVSLPEGHGLALLRSRLAMLYGDRASLDIRSRPAATSVIVQVPG